MGSWCSASTDLAIGRVLDTLRFDLSHKTTRPFRNRAVALMENWAATFRKNQNPSEEVMLAVCSAAWPTPNQCTLLDWKRWRAEFNREVNLMQHKEPCSIFEGRNIERPTTRIQHMRRCEGTRWTANEIARRPPPEPCVQRAARFYEAIVTKPFRQLFRTA